MEDESKAIKKEEALFTFNTEDILTDPACEIIDILEENEPKEEISVCEAEKATNSSSFTLKIADFAIDPDSCSVINEIPQNTVSNQEIAPASNNSRSLQIINLEFPHMICQFTKLYQVKYSSNSPTRDYVILTSSLSSTNTENTEYKLFIESHNISEGMLADLKVYYDTVSDTFLFNIWTTDSLSAALHGTLITCSRL